MTESHSGPFSLPVSLRIRRSLPDVFRAWVDRDVAENWLCDRLEGEWKAGEKIYWHFGDYRQELRIVKVEKEKLIEFQWNAYSTQPERTAKIEFRDLGDEVGLILTESSFDLTLESVKWALDSACGWENVFCRCKAWVEAKVKLR